MVTLTNSLRVPASEINYSTLEALILITSGSNPAYKSYQRLLKLHPYLARSGKVVEPPKTINLLKIIEDDVGDTLYYEVPRGLYSFFVDRGHTIDDQTSSRHTEFKLLVELRDYQIEAVDDIIANRFGYLTAPTGSGKTLMAFAIASRLKQKILFIVHTKTLLKQTVEGVKKYLGIDAGIIGDGKFEIKDFTVATIQTLLRRDSSTYRNEFGLIVLDESHHVPATTFTKVIGLFNAKYVYGLSATPEREDGLTWVLDAAIGPCLHEVNRDKLVTNKSIIKPKVIAIETPYIATKEYDPFDVAAHINAVSKDPIRNKFLVQYIEQVIKDYPNTKPVILTDRVAHAEWLAQQLSIHNPVLYHAQLTNKDQRERLEQIKNSDGVFTIATYTSIGEGFDVPLWDTLFLATPFSSTTRLIQVLGRISRPAIGKDKAYVHDFVDVNDQVLVSRYEKRKIAYQALE